MQKSPQLKIDTTAAIVLTFVLAIACSTEELAERSTHRPAEPENSRNISSGPVYVEALGLKEDNSKAFLQIKGHLPTPCHRLSPPVRHQHSDTLSITLSSWQRSDVMCAQVLEPFVFYLELNDEELDLATVITCNGITITP
ncbi:hypothetical protein QA596_11945 [Balneolales bacterium ANBcel1]|nr:hypothetical protein [Balneolales bacterium ANBcel1]